MYKLTLFLLVLLFSQHAFSQSRVKNVPFRNVGPSVMSGRVVDMDINKAKPSEFYVAYASGGVWYTNNNGASFTPIMDASGTNNVGDIAVDWNKGTIWIGTGEVNSSRSSYQGIGLLRSDDKGKTWRNMGLKETHHISRILINPNNPNQILVAAIGHLYTTNKERGVFRSVDGGKTWKKTLFIDEKTGVIDLDAVPGDFNTLYASAWQRDRKAWHFDGDGIGSAVYKSTDMGQTWQKITTKANGFLTGEGVGRIGVAVFDKNTLYAVVDNQFRRPKTESKTEAEKGLNKETFQKISPKELLAIEDKKLEDYLRTNYFPKKYSAQSVKALIKTGKAKPIDIATYRENANSALFDTPVVGAEVYRSDDGGKSWKKANKEYIDGLFYSYGYYFGKIEVNPHNAEHIYITGVPLLKSEDGGATYKSINKENVHADHHFLWINPNLEGHLINGNDGGVNITYDDGENWFKNNQPAVGQFYTVNVDNETPYNVYGGLQDNGVWLGAHTYSQSKYWEQSGKYGYSSIMGGDGMQVQIDNRDANIVYTGYQFGNYYRINRQSKKNSYITPQRVLGEPALRFNWQTPIQLSSHNQDILYMGSNKLHRSMDKGANWQEISPDLTHGAKKGNVAYGTLTTLSESPFQFGLIYTGSDDGYIYITKNGGGSWKNISKKLPQNLWVSRIIASSHKKERVYATLNGYRNDDFKSYVYVSENYGSSWKKITSGLSNFPVNVIKEDPHNANILYLGNDNALFISFDKGKKWEKFEQFPPVAVHDLVIQEREKDLVVGTHGRSIYIADTEAFSTLSDAETTPSFKLLKPKSMRHSSRWGKARFGWVKPFTPELNLTLYSNKAGKMVLSVFNEENNLLSQTEHQLEAGFNYVKYNLKQDQKQESPFLTKGTYRVEAKLGSDTSEQSFELK